MLARPGGCRSGRAGTGGGWRDTTVTCESSLRPDWSPEQPERQPASSSPDEVESMLATESRPLPAAAAAPSGRRATVSVITPGFGPCERRTEVQR